MKLHFVFLVGIMLVAGLFSVYSMIGVPPWVIPAVHVLVGLLAVGFGYFAAGTRSRGEK